MKKIVILSLLIATDLNTVNIHITRITQTPVKDTNIGKIEYPIPLRLPTKVSMIPHKQYIVLITANRSIPN